MNCILYRIIQLGRPINWSPIIILNDKQNISNQCLFSWSTDKCCWTGWNTYQTYLQLCNRIESDFYLKIKIPDKFTSILLNGVNYTDFTINLNDENVFLQDFCNNTNLFDPYNDLDCALLLQQQLSDSVICMLGIPVYYIKTEAKTETADYTFKEYVLHNVESIKIIKLMLQDGALPSSSPNLTLLDFDWQTDWEVEISKTQFAKAFGDTSFPHARDFIYVPMMKRMWEVNSAYDEKSEGLLWRSTTWKLTLKKYEDSTNVDVGNYEDIIDSWRKNKYDDIFGIIENNEQERKMGSTPLSAPQIASTNIYPIFMEDAVRLQLSKNDIQIIQKQINHGANIVARNFYKFKTQDAEIVYQKQICGHDGTISFILETPGSQITDLNHDIIHFGELVMNISYIKEKDKYSLNYAGNSWELDPFNIYLITCRWSKSNYSQQICIYNYGSDQNKPAYLLQPHSYKFKFDTPLYEENILYNNDLDMRTGNVAKIAGYPVYLSNIKYYNCYLNQEDLIKECIKYVTTNENCVINDLARPIDDGHGYAVK